MNDKHNYSIRWTQPYHHVSGWRKRQTIDRVLNEMHSTQLDMIDEAVEKSDLQQAKDVIEYIKNKA